MSALALTVDGAAEAPRPQENLPAASESDAARAAGVDPVGTATSEPASAPAAPVLQTGGQRASLGLADLLKHAAELSGRSLQQVLTEIARLAFGPGKISTDEYFALGLYDDAALAGTDKRAFVGVKAARQIWVDVNHRHDWYGFIDDKLAVEAMLRGAGIATTRTTAMVAKGGGRPGLTHLADREALVAFLRREASYPLFAKPHTSLRSYGAASFIAYDRQCDCLVARFGGGVSVEAFADEVMANYADGYLFQELLAPHRDIAALCGERIATIRVVTLADEAGPAVWRTAWKIPAGTSVADNYWRGNILATIDPASGTIARAVRHGGATARAIETHPDTGATLVGALVPHWDAVKAIACEAAALFPGIPLIGWDIAVTDEGPVIVEPNHTPDFILPQIADRSGVLDERLVAAVARGKASAKARKRSLKAFDRREGMGRVRQVVSG